jgi:hypothetical protein
VLVWAMGVQRLLGVMKHFLAIAGVLGFLLAAITAEADGPIDPTKGCKSNPSVVGPCVTLRGRISAANGAYPMRVWPVGSKRYLAVLPVEDEIAPRSIKDQFSFDTRIFADLLICPFSEQRPEEMQFVCIESATNIHVDRN